MLKALVMNPKGMSDIPNSTVSAIRNRSKESCRIRGAAAKGVSGQSDPHRVFRQMTFA